MMLPGASGDNSLENKISGADSFNTSLNLLLSQPSLQEILSKPENKHIIENIFVEIQRKLNDKSTDFSDVNQTHVTFLVDSAIEISKNASKVTLLDLMCSILNKLFDKMGGLTVIRKHQIDILKLLSSGNYQLVQVATKTVIDGLEKNKKEVLEELSTSSVALTIGFIRLILLEEEGMMSLGMSPFLKMKDDVVNVVFCNPAVQQEMNNTIESKNDVLRFRIYEFIIKCCVNSKPCLEYCIEKGALNKLMEEIDSADVLCRLNALEMLADFASTSREAAESMRFPGVSLKVYKMLIETATDPDSIFTFPAVIRFFGYLGRVYPEEVDASFPKFIQSVFDLITKYDMLEPAQRLLAFDTLAIFGGSVAGKKILAKYEENMKESMRCFSGAIRSGPVEIRGRHLEALKDLLSFIPIKSCEEMQDDEDSKVLGEITKNWFNSMTPPSSNTSPLETIVNLFKQPVEDLHLPAGNVVKAILDYDWGQKNIARHPGLLEYLLNRGTESEISGRHLKFEILKKIASSPLLNELYSPENVISIRTYVEQGAFYVEAQLEVATERN